MKVWGAAAVIIIILFVGFIVYSMWLDSTGSTVYGKVVGDIGFQGSGQITSEGLGGSNGQTAAIPYHILTVAYNGKNYTLTLTCDFYKTGDQLPLATLENGEILPRITAGNGDPYGSETSILQPGCVMIG